MKFSEFFTYLLCPPKCAACGKTIGLSFLRSPLCEECERLFQNECNEICTKCQKRLSECDCIPSSLAENGCLFSCKLMRYYGGDIGKASNKIVYEMKSSSDVRLYRFIADKLSENAVGRIESAARACSAEKIYVTYVPRSISAVAKYGHDQARCLALALSDRLGIPCVKLVRRNNGRHKEMKKLTYSERFVESSTVYAPVGNMPSLDDAFVIIVDDVVTSGASVLAVSRLLFERNVCGFGVISVGVSILKDTKTVSEEKSNE